MEQAKKLLKDIPLREHPPAFLIAADVSGEYGGTGHKANWEIAHTLALKYPILLAGGLKPENILISLSLEVAIFRAILQLFV